MYQAIYEGIFAETTGVYKVYGISDEGARELRRIHDNKVSGSNGTYTIFDEAKTHMWLRLYVRDCNTMIRFDIREKLLDYTGMQRFSSKFIKSFNEAFPKVINIEYNVDKKRWECPTLDQVIADVLKSIKYYKKK